MEGSPSATRGGLKEAQQGDDMSVAEVIAAYFRGEKSEAVLIMLAGAVSLAAALWLWFSVREPFARGLAAALLILAALGLTIDYYAEARAARYAEGLETAGVLPAR